MTWLIVSASNLEPALRSVLRRHLVEVPGTMFVGRPDSRTAEFLSARIRQTRGSAVIVRPCKNEIGFVIEMVNHQDVVMRDFDGLHLPMKRRNTADRSADGNVGISATGKISL